MKPLRALGPALITLAALAALVSADTLLFHDDFEAGLDPIWVTPGKHRPNTVLVEGGWLHTEDTVVLPGIDSFTFVHDGDAAWLDYTLRLTVDPIDKFVAGSGVQEHADVFFRTSDMAPAGSGADFDGYRLSLGGPLHAASGSLGPYVGLARYTKGAGATSLFSDTGHTTSGPMDVVVNVHGPRITVAIDEPPVIDLVDPAPHLYGGIGVGGMWEAHNRFDDVTVTTTRSLPPFTAVSFSVDRGAEGIECGVQPLNFPNDVYALGTAPPNNGALGGHQLATEGDIFLSGTTGLNAPPDKKNIDRISGALGTVPRVGPHAPPPAAPPVTGHGVLGLIPTDNMNALSYGLDSGEVLYFSVDPDALGVPGTDVHRNAVLSGNPGAVPAGTPLPVNPGGGDPGDEAAGDIYVSQRFVPFGHYRWLHFAMGRTATLVAPPNDNLLVCDDIQLGLQAPALNGAALGAPEDDLDGLELADPSDRTWGCDYDGNGLIDADERPVWFSLDPQSPSSGRPTILAGGPIQLATPSPDLAATPDDILMVVAGWNEDLNNNGILDAGEDTNADGRLFLFAVYASGVLDIGLLPGDDLDALVLSDVVLAPDPWFLDPGLDEALLSLAPNSPSLAGADGVFGTPDDWSAADVFYTDFLQPFNPSVHWTLGGSMYAHHYELGLLFDDNLNALDILPVPEPAGLAALGLLALAARRRRRL